MASVARRVGRAMLRGMAWLVSEARVLASAELADDRRTRRRGLLGRSGLDGALALRPCRWVHSVGMRFPLDVAFVDDDGIVVKVVRMPRHRLGLPVPSASWVIEAEAGAFERWGLLPGDEVELRTEAERSTDDAGRVVGHG